MINDENINQDFPPLKHSRPAASNCAISYAISLGFTKTYLFGTDLGEPKNQQLSSDDQDTTTY